MTDKMREEFEKWALTECFDLTAVGGFYSDNETDAAYKAWQAARTVPEGWMRDKKEVEGLIVYLEGVAYQCNKYGVVECVNQAAAMSIDVLRLVLLPMLSAAPEGKK